MLKELIVSVNGREKKIAIIEDGKVTEFYIERGESDQGIVGNIYKGRVMRVLPGMQSAFVDIGLERDAFLYVSDFFDEEEEFERIVMDKPKEAAASAAPIANASPAAEAAPTAAVAAQADVPAERQPDRGGRERDSRGGGGDARRGRGNARGGRGNNYGRQNDFAATTPAAPEQQRAEMIAESAEGNDQLKAPYAQPDGANAKEFYALDVDRREQSDAGGRQVGQVTGTRHDSRFPVDDEADNSTPFVVRSVDAFQRIEDDEAAEDGSMLKDAMLQERIADRIHAVDFDFQTEPETDQPAADRFFGSAEQSFQRVEDGEETVFEEAAITSPARVTARLDAFFDEAASLSRGDEVAPTRGAGVFERVSDDEENSRTAGDREAAAQPQLASIASGEEQTIAEKPSRRGGNRRQSGEVAARPSRRAKTESAAETESATPTEEVAAPAAAEESKPKRGRAARGKADGDKAPSEKETVGGATSRRGRRNDKRTSAEKDSVSATGQETISDEDASARQITLDDAEASFGSTPSRGEFATRRGGRRRRRGGSNGGGKAPGAGTDAVEGDEQPGDGGEADQVDSPTDEVESEEVHAEQTAQPAAAAATTTSVAATASPSSPPPAVAAASSPAPRSPAQPAAEQQQQQRYGGGNDRRGGGNNGGGGGNRQSQNRSRRGERPAQPTITDLLREGQEVLVQIAKEPISQKGARITSHIALPGRFLVYMPTIEHVGVSRKIESDGERARLRKLIQAIRAEEDVPSGGFIVRTAGVGISEEDLRDDARYLVRTWLDIRRSAERSKAPAPVHRDLDLVQRLLRDQLSEEFSAIRVDSEEVYLQIVEFVNRIQPRLVGRVKLYTREEPILEAYGVQTEIDKAVKPRVWLRSGGYLVINQTEALVAIDVNTGKFVGRGGNRLEDTITKTNLEAVDEIVRQIRLRDLGGIIVLDLIDMEERRNRTRVMQALQEALQNDKSPTKVLSFNDFGLVIMTRKRVKQSLERTLCAPCPYCTGAGLVKSPQTVCYEALEEARRLARGMNGEAPKQVTLRVNPEVARALRTDERDVLTEIEDHLGPVDVTSDEHVHQEQYDFAFV